MISSNAVMDMCCPNAPELILDWGMCIPTAT